MPKNKTQGIIFGIIMSYSMAVGMEIYNNAIQQGVHLQPGGFTNLTYGIVGKALVEALFMGLIVIIVSELWGNRLGARFAAKVSDPQRDNPYFCRLMRQAGTVSVMCPTMSLAATIIFSMILGGAPVWQLPAIWAGTLIKNFPMAFFGICLPPHPLPTGPAESCSNKRALPRRGSALAYITGTNSTFRSTISLTPSSRAPWSYCHTSKR